MPGGELTLAIIRCVNVGGHAWNYVITHDPGDGRRTIRRLGSVCSA